MRPLHKMTNPEAMVVDQRLLSTMSACLVTLLGQGKHQGLFEGIVSIAKDDDNSALVDHLMKAYEAAEMHRPDTPLRIAAMLIECLRSMLKPKYGNVEPLIEAIAEALGKFTGVIPLEEGERFLMDRVEIDKHPDHQFMSSNAKF